MELAIYMSVNLTTGEITAGTGHPNGEAPEVIDGEYYLPMTAQYSATVTVVGSQLTVTFEVTGYTVP